MAKIEWNRPQDHVLEAGLDHGVIYVENGPAVPWNGLISVEDKGQSTMEEFFLDGVVFLVVVSPRKYEGSISAYTYPEEFSELIGYGELGDGLYADSQLPQPFHLSYRTMVGSPNVDNKQHYKIHLIYQTIAQLSDISYETLGDSPEPSSFEFDLSAVPQRVRNALPSAHFIIDSRKISDENLAELEAILYGSDTVEARMPTVEQLIDLTSFGDMVVVVYNGDGTWTATGSNKNITMLDDIRFKIDNVAAEYLSDTIYRFLGLEGSVAMFSVLADTDGEPYYILAEDGSNLGVDTDGTPYYGEDVFGATLDEDTDGTPYFSFN